MKPYIKAFLNLGVLFIFSVVAFSACAESSVEETRPGNIQMAGSSTPARVTETTPAADRQPETVSAPALDPTSETETTLAVDRQPETASAPAPGPTSETETTLAVDRQPETASAPAPGPTSETETTSSALITRQEVVVMFDSVENFTSVINRLDGLNDDEKQTLFYYITQELELNSEIHQNCTASLTDEERAALHDMDMGSLLYQQANEKFIYATIHTPACSQPHQELAALMSQYDDLIIKVKSLVSPYMTP